MNSKVIIDRTRHVLLLGGVAISISVQAASFDCEKAKSIVERQICADPALSHLDDELATAYTIALQNKGRADEVRRDQKRWLKDRNDCGDMACIKRTYEVRLSSIRATHAPSSNGGISRPNLTSEIRLPVYGHCVDVGIPGSCEQGQFAKTGKGYAVCEAYLRHVNSVEKLPKCEAPLPPGFKSPDWEDMDVVKNLHIAYQAEKLFSEGWGGYTHPDFEIWKNQFLNESQTGKITPQIRKTQVRPFGKEVVSILAYTRDRTACEKDAYRQESRWANNGHAHFLLQDLPQAPLRAIDDRLSKEQSELLLYAGRPYFVLRTYYEASIEVVAFDLEMTNTARKAAIDSDTYGGASSATGTVSDVSKKPEFKSDIYWAGRLCHFSKIIRSPR